MTLLTPWQIAQERARAVSEARSWNLCPYHHRAMIKGAGVDCAMLLVAVYVELGYVEKFALPEYPPDWHLHRSEEIYLNIVQRYCDEIEGPPEPADIVLYQFGRCYAHGGVVIQWPIIIHAVWRNGKVFMANGDTGELANIIESPDPDKQKPRKRRYFRLKRWAK